MANRVNEIFIGSEHLSTDGRDIKHPALIKLYRTINAGKISEEMIKFIGLDLETNHLTAELKLLGFWNGKAYKYYTSNFIDILFQFVKYASDNNFTFAHWNKLDPTVIYKQFLLQIDDEEIRYKSLERYGKISGEWNKKEKEWTLPPVIEIDMGDYKFGIQNAVRSSIKFFYYNKILKELNTCWAYDIAGLFQNKLEDEAKDRLPYYSKVDQSAHLVDWDRFNNDKYYRKEIVLKSNELDARAVYDLAGQINEEFKRAFGYYPRSLISQGSFARAALVAVITNQYKNLEDEKKRTAILRDLQSICITTHIDAWNKKHDKKVIQDFYQCMVEAYSAGYIEAIRYGYTKEAYFTDIASAYPGVIQYLYDLTDSIVSSGTGEPPHIDKSYCFIRGKVNIPDIDFIPITIKHYFHKSTNIRAVGEYYASYMLDERDYLSSLGAKFTDEKWFNVETKGILSPIAEVVKEFTALRDKLIALNDSAQYSAKIANNSCYGILFEAVPVYELDDENDIIKTGYSAGEFFNPLYASIITGRTRILLAKAGQAIENNGGKVILLMTDSVFWEGSADMLPNEMWREKKTLGFYEKPVKVFDMICLGSGRYGYSTIGKNGKEKYIAKRRGLNASGIVDIGQDPLQQSSIITEFNWWNMLKMACKNNQTTIKVKVRLLISVGVVLGNHKYKINDLGLVTEEFRDIELIVGGDKRYIPVKAGDPNILLKELVKTNSLTLTYDEILYKGLYDGTLPNLREMCNKLDFKTKHEKVKEANKKNRKTFYDKNKEKVRLPINENYKRLREAGYSSLEAKKYSNRSLENIEFLLLNSVNINKNMVGGKPIKPN